MMERRVLFPAPFGPKRNVIAPDSKLADTERRAHVEPKSRVTFTSSMR